MSVFNRDDDAYAAWTKAIEDFAGNPGSPAVIQSPTVLRPLKVKDDVNPNLAWFRRLIVGDSIPLYGKLNPLAYVDATNKSVGDGYKQYIAALNAVAIRKYVNPNDQAEIDKAVQSYIQAQTALTAFVRDATRDWVKQKSADPELSRAAWDDSYGSMGYTPERNLLLSDSQMKYGKYKALATPYPELARIAESLSKVDSGSTSQVYLPNSEAVAKLGPDAWDPYFRTDLDLGIDWSDFWANDAPDARAIREDSATSSSYEHRWSAGGSASYGFFNVGGSASGGNIERHFREGTQALRMSFKRLVLGTVTRGKWFDGGLVSSAPYYKWVDADEYWGANGTLNLIPTGVIIGRGLTIEIDTSQTAYDEFQSWYQQSAGGGFSFGPWSVGGSEGSSTSSDSVTNTSSGQTVRIVDNSAQAYLIGVISLKMDDLAANQEVYRRIALTDLAHNEQEEEERSARNPSLVFSD